MYPRDQASPAISRTAAILNDGHAHVGVATGAAGGVVEDAVDLDGHAGETGEGEAGERGPGIGGEVVGVDGADGLEVFVLAADHEQPSTADERGATDVRERARERRFNFPRVGGG